jgi:hypothetical protein
MASSATRAAGQDQGGQAELGVGILGDREQLGHLGLGLVGLGGLGLAGPGAVDVDWRRGRQPGIGDALGDGKAPQPGQPVRRVGTDHRQVSHPGQLDVCLQRRVADHDEFFAQIRGLGDDLAELGDQAIGRNGGQEPVIEMLGQLVIGGGRPARAAGVGEAGDHPAQLGQGVAFRPGLWRLG